MCHFKVCLEMNLDSVLYDVIDSTNDFYIFTSAICRTFSALEKAEPFNYEQIEKFVSNYLNELTKAGLLIESKYPHTEVSRYRKADLFRSLSNPPETGVEAEFTRPFLLDLEMQRALCNFRMLECKSRLDIQVTQEVSGLTIEGSKELNYLNLKDRIRFLQKKIYVIDELLDMYCLGF